MERARPLRRHAIENLGQFRPALAAGRIRIAAGQIQHRVDGLDGRGEELDRRGILGATRGLSLIHIWPPGP